MKVLVADSFEQSGIDGLKAAGCEVVYKPELKDDALAARHPRHRLPTCSWSAAPRSPARCSKAVRCRSSSARAPATTRSTSRRRPGAASTCRIVPARTRLPWPSSRSRCCSRSIAACPTTSRTSAPAPGTRRSTRRRAGCSAGRSACSATAASARRWPGARTRSACRSSSGAAGSPPAGTTSTNQAVPMQLASSPAEVAARCDVLSVHLALNADTKGLVNASVLDKLKPGSYFINTARAEVVDYDALERAVRERDIRVGLDVFAAEPTSATGEFKDAIVALKNVYGTHHVGASTDQAQDAIAAETVRIVTSYKDTGKVPNVVNLAKQTPATHMLVVRHRDRPGRARPRLRSPAQQRHQRAGNREHHLRRRAGRRRAHQSRRRPVGGAAEADSRRETATSSICIWSRFEGVATKARRIEPRRVFVSSRALERRNDHRSSRLQLLRRPRGPAGVRSRRDSARPRVAAGRRHVDPRDQPPVGGVRVDPGAGGGRHPRAGGHSVELQSAVPAGRRQPAVLDGADEPAHAGRDRRLHRLRILGREGDQGSEARRRRQRRRDDQGRELFARAAAGRAEAHAGRRVRPHDVEQHDRRHRIQGAAGGRRRAARQRHVVGHVQPSDRRRPPRADLLRRAEEHGAGRRHGGHRPRRPAAALEQVAADDAELRGACGERVDVQHAAGVRRVRARPGDEVADRRGRTYGDCDGQRAQGGEALRRDRSDRLLSGHRRTRNADR